MTSFFKCTHCGRVLNTAQGLKSHITRLHRLVLTEPNNAPGSSSQTFVKTTNFGQVSQETKDSTQAGSEDMYRVQPPLETLGGLLASLRRTTKIIHRIPKGARTKAAEALADTIDKCVQDNLESSWKRLLIFAAVCFQVPISQESRKVSLATMVNRNIGDFLQGHIPTPRLVTCKERREGDVPNLEKLAKTVEAKVAEADVAGAVRILCSGASLAPFNEETRRSLLNLHPIQESPTRIEISHQETLNISVTEVRGAITSFPPGSAGGMDFLRPQHLKDLTGKGTGQAGQRLLVSIRSLCNIMLAGGVPAEICPVLYGASLCALAKSKGGVRPIAVGSTWRRLVAKLGSFRIKPQLSETLRPVQLGFGIKGGAEGAAHAARRFVNFDHKHTKVLLKVDFRNAFNSVDRNLMLRLVSERMPELYPFLFQCYGSPTHLTFGEELLSSRGGIQQGDPLGPALFCLVAQPMASAIVSELNIWYLDDATIGGRPEDVLNDIKILHKEMITTGLEINFEKCELFILNHTGQDEFDSIRESFRVTFPGIRFPDLKECTLLGAPLTLDAIAGCLDEKSRDLERMSSRLELVKSHVAYYLLKNTQSIPKLTYLLRCAPTWKYEPGLMKFDDILRRVLESVTNIRLEEVAWKQSALPVVKVWLFVW